MLEACLLLVDIPISLGCLPHPSNVLTLNSAKETRSLGPLLLISASMDERLDACNIRAAGGSKHFCIAAVTPSLYQHLKMRQCANYAQRHCKEYT
jgi:hypothetical protein